MPNMPEALGALSRARREGLAGYLHVNDVQQSVKIETYYSIADRAFNQAVDYYGEATKSPARDWREAHARQQKLDRL